MTDTRQVKNFIHGEFRESPDQFEVMNPATGQLAAVGHQACAEDVNDAVDAARQALKGSWQRMADQERYAMMRQATHLILERKDAFIDAEMTDAGHPINALSHIEIPRGAQQLAAFAEIAAGSDEIENFETPMPDGRTASNVTQRTPKGVIGAISPWNLPLIMATWKLAPALAWGNTIVLKPSEHSPSTAALLGEVFQQAGFPPGVVNIIHGTGPGATGAHLCRHPDVDAINFTGATRTGSAIMSEAAVGIRDISLELGGKNAAVILDDCDMDAAVAGTVQSAFFNCGQVCLGTERIYVQASVYPEFLKRLAIAAQSLSIGDPASSSTQMGPLVSREHQQKVLDCYATAKSEGATIVCGGGQPAVESALQRGAWIEPTIWTGLDEHSQTVKEEIFGPCCHVTPVSDEAQAIALANDSRYGLAASVWSSSQSRAEAVATELNAGVVWINGWMIRDLRTAFGGFGQSGIGREGGIHAREFHTELKNVCRVEGTTR